MAKLALRITDQGFLFRLPDGTHELAQKLFGPLSCHSERMEVVRDGTVHDTCTIEILGTHAPYAGFNGLSRITSGQYHQSLEFTVFEDYELIRITGIDDRVGVKDYWRELTSGVVVRLPWKVEIRELVVGERFFHGRVTYEVTEFNRSGKPWPAPIQCITRSLGTLPGNFLFGTTEKVVPFVPQK